MISKRLFLWVNIGLVLAIAIGAVLLGLMVLQGPAQAKVPQGVSYNVIYLSSTQVQVEFGNFSDPVSFSELIVEVTAPNGDVCKADVKNSTTDYPQKATIQSLSNIRVSSTGTMDKGASFIMINNNKLQTGPWAFKMTYRSTGQQVSGGTIIVPDVDSTPKGSFSGLNKISSSEVRLGLNTSVPITEYSYCYVEAWGPNMTTTTLYLNDTTSMRVQMDDGTMLKVIDSNGDGLINTGDYASLQILGKDLAKGQWSIAIKYAFTNENIAIAVFDLK